MNGLTFVDLVKHHFDFLVSDFNCKLIYAANVEVRPQTDGTVKYQSNNIIITIASETGYASLNFARVTDGEKYYLSATDIHEYLNTTDKEKEILLSINPADQPAAIRLFNERFLLNQPGWREGNGSKEGLEKDLQNFAHWLKEHTELCLGDTFVNWLQFYEYRVQRSRANHLRQGKNEISSVGVLGADGKWKLVKQSVFKDRLDYIEKLRNENPK